MIVTLSPAKLMDFKKNVSVSEQTTPLFEKQADNLIELLQDFNMDGIAGLMDISGKQAFEVYHQIQAFHHPRTIGRQAAFAYNGIAYKGLDIESFSAEEADYAQDHLVILSGLYGALRPLDIIKPYRLEMQIKLPNEKGENLYNFWTEILTQYLLERLNDDDKIWVNLMSNEYTNAINRKKLSKSIQIITPNFKEHTAKGYRQIVVYTKKARGMMARFILKNRIAEIDHLKAFDDEGYMFSPELSKKDEIVFVR